MRFESEKSREPDLWAVRYNPVQVALIKALSKRTAAHFSASILDFVPQWFEDAPALPGTKGVAAPQLDQESQAKFDALYRYYRAAPQQGDADKTWTLAHAASAFAAVFLWEAMFAEEFHGRLPNVSAVMDFDPRANDLAQVIETFRQYGTPMRMVTGELTLLDCYRLSNQRR